MAYYYFEMLPGTYYDFTGQKPAEFTLVRNIFRRARIKDSIKNDASLYYTYPVKDGDTPEIIAEKYYGSAYDYWIVLMMNDQIDRYTDWVKPYDTLIKCLEDDYGSVANSQAAIARYEKHVTKLDSASGLETTFKYTIDATTYAALPDSSFETVNLAGGTIHITTTKHLVDVYTDELEKNEAKRNIRLLKKEYAEQIRQEFEQLMRD